MAWNRLWIVIVAGLATALPVWAGGPPVSLPKKEDDARRLSARIDQLIAAGWHSNGDVKPSPLTGDGAFLRRLSLDVTGKIPLVSDARRFLDDGHPEKRFQAIDRLLDSPGYATHFTNIWRDLLLPEANADFQKRFFQVSMERWLKAKLSENTSYDQMVRELLTLPLTEKADNRFYARLYNGQGKPNPMTFYMAKAGKAEDLAASVARTFLGVRIECAQCHDHPVGKWKREDFWGTASFFAGINRNLGENNFQPLSEVADRREMAIPNTERVASARFLDGKEPRWKFKVGARETLADWMTARDNPFLARALVNRMWAHFFGVGIVDPVDDMSDLHSPSHPELLDELAREFVAHDFDLKFLVRAITGSKTYQLSSTGDSDLRLFARMPLKGLTTDQLYDSLLVVTGTKENMDRRQRVFAMNTPRQDFMDKFATQDRPTEYQTSIPQALTLMNNKLIVDATHPERGEVLGAVANASFMSTKAKIETLFLASLSRKPTPEELDRLTRYVEKGGAASSEKKALGDVFWALLNSTEFLFNH